tara:strand:+ start:319 stop:603 length:285 start_codon:yes stop_codon:yes gene_type:complete
MHEIYINVYLMNSNKQNLINKIKYRSQYRGTKEMDIYVSSFVEHVINDLNINELEQLNNLVNLNDEDFIDISKGNLNKDIDDKIINLLIKFKKN